MGSLWGLALPLFFCCWEAEAPRSSEGPDILRPGPLVTRNHPEVSAVTLGVNTSSEGNSQKPDLAETSVPSHTSLETQTLGTQPSDRTLIPVSTISEAETKETKTIFPATETKALTETIPSKFMSVITTPMETLATGGNPSGSGMTTVESITCSDLSKAVFDILCTDDSCEEAERITADTSTLAYTSAEARVLALESTSVPAITTSQALAPDITALPKALVAHTTTNIEVTNCSLIEIKTTSITPETSDIDHSPTGEKTLSTPAMSVLPDFTEAKSHLIRTTIPSETLSTASATESAPPNTTVETPFTASSTTEGEITTAKATPSRTLVTVSMKPSEEASAPSVQTTNRAEVSGAVTISTEAGSTVDKVMSTAGSSAMVHSFSEVATTVKNSTLSETSTIESTTSGPVPISRSPLPSVHLTMANSSQETDITLGPTKTLKTASTAKGKPPIAMPAITGTTEVTAGGEGGFLLLRLSVASPEDLTDPRVAESLMYQIHHELHAHMPLIQVSLLHVRRD